jgi:hypothetical protein
MGIGVGTEWSHGWHGKLAQTVAWLPTPARSVEEGPLDWNRQRGEKGEGSCARPAGKKRHAHSPAARRCSSAVVGVASVSAQGGAMPRADGSELWLRVMTANTAGSPGGKRCRGDRTAQLGVGWSSGGSQRPARSFGQDGSSDRCCRSGPIMPTRVTDSAAPGSQSAHGAWQLSRGQEGPTCQCFSKIKINPGWKSLKINS